MKPLEIFKFSKRPLSMKDQGCKNNIVVVEGRGGENLRNGEG
jgi:hypothetical protein